jgi:hypothetical protein
MIHSRTWHLRSICQPHIGHRLRALFAITHVNKPQTCFLALQPDCCMSAHRACILRIELPENQKRRQIVILSTRFNFSVAPISFGKKCGQRINNDQLLLVSPLQGISSRVDALTHDPHEPSCKRQAYLVVRQQMHQQPNLIFVRT